VNDRLYLELMYIYGKKR